MAAWLALPLAPRDASDRTDHYLGTVARLAPGADLRAAQQDLARVAAELRRERPDAYPDPKWTIGAVSLRDRHFGDMRLPLTALLVASGAVLLIACVNVAIMALLRALARRRELAIRLAIGAGRASIVRQLLTEAAVLAAIGAARRPARGARPPSPRWSRSRRPTSRGSTRSASTCRPRSSPARSSSSSR